MLEEKEVTWFPSYGAEVRGGTANCTVVLADELIGSPVVEFPDILIVMNEASLLKFQSRLKKDGILFYDSSLINSCGFRDDVSIVGVPATEIATKIGSTRSANMVMLGSFIGKTNLIKKRTAVKSIECLLSDKLKKYINDNKKAISEGIKYLENKKS
jgi:2-oxoglutarate ferredoxin oxidoreductase subunit gamma